MVSELLFLDSDEDSVWTEEEVLFELLQYFNLHIIQSGKDFYIFDWEMFNKTCQNNNLTYIDLFSNNTAKKHIVSSINNPYLLDTSMYGASDTNLTISDVYNKIQITCNFQDIEDVIESPFEEDFLVSPYQNKQLYATEVLGSTRKSLENFIQSGTYNFDDDKMIVNDYYIQVMSNPNWILKDAPNGLDILSYLQQDSSGNLYKQWYIPSRFPNAPEQCCIFSIGTNTINVKNLKSDNSEAIKPKLDMSNYIVISINGNEKHDSTHYPTDNVIQNAIPVAEYNGNISGGVYSPIDGDTTNYIVFSGKLQYQPVEVTKESNSWWNIYAASGANLNHVDYYDDNWIYRAMRYYNSDYRPVKLPGGGYAHNDFLDTCFAPGQFTKGYYEYSHSEMSDGSHTSIDNISKLPVLECELIIGDKCLVEDIDSDGNSQYNWYNTSTGNPSGRKSFSLGIDPKIGDYIIGPEYDIANNITFEMNLDGAEGTAIPIKKSDNLAGQIHFRILGPVNTVWNQITRIHPSFWRHTSYTSDDKYLLAQTKNIIIKDFECKFYSDNAGY